MKWAQCLAMSEHSSYISSESASRITLVSVSGLNDAQAAGWALTLSQSQMPGCKALLCSPIRPVDLPASVEHLVIAPLDYQGYSWFMLFMLWRVVHTDFALVVQDDGWVLDGKLWRDEYLNYDYIGAPTHLAHVLTPEGDYWSRGFAWAEHLEVNSRAVPVLNGGFSLRSRKLMQVFAEYPQLHVVVPAPDQLTQYPFGMSWSNDALNEDVQLTGILRPQLEALGLRFPSTELAASFAIEYAAPFHKGVDALTIFGHHGRTRKLAGLQPLTVQFSMPQSQVSGIWGEADLARMLEQRGYRIQYEPEKRPRKVYDCFTYNGEFEVLQIRLHELAEVVDYFVIVEATRTFSGNTKTLTLDLSKPELAPFLGRIRYIVVDDMPGDPIDINPEDIECDWLNDPPKTGFWRRENHQRNQIMRGIEDAHPDDLIMVSDADEILRANVVVWMREQSLNQVFGLQLGFYYFYANYRNVAGGESKAIWGTAASRNWFDQGTPDQLRLRVRMGRIPARLLADAGWHFAYLGMDENQIRKKIASFSHQEYNNEAMLASIDLSAMIKSGRDLYGRTGYEWVKVSREDAPAWMIANEKLSWLFI